MSYDFEDGGLGTLKSQIPPAPIEWRCFYCNEVFTDPKEALVHFGNDRLDVKPGCIERLSEAETVRRRALIAAKIDEYNAERMHNAADAEFYYGQCQKTLLKSLFHGAETLTEAWQCLEHVRSELLAALYIAGRMRSLCPLQFEQLQIQERLYDHAYPAIERNEGQSLKLMFRLKMEDFQ